MIGPCDRENTGAFGGGGVGICIDVKAGAIYTYTLLGLNTGKVGLFVSCYQYVPKACAEASETPNGSERDPTDLLRRKTAFVTQNPP